MIPTLAQDVGDIVPIVALSVGGLVALTAIVVTSLRWWLESKERERSRREIAAYVAEGSISPEEGERLIAAGRENGSDDCFLC